MSKRKDRRSELSRSSQHEQWLIELWGTHQALRNLGFNAESIYVGFGDVLNVGPDMVFVSLQAQGKEFVYTVVQVRGGTEETVFKRWVDFIGEMQTLSPDDLERVGRSSQIGSDVQVFFDLAATLAKRGFEIPNLPEGMGAVAALFGYDMPPLKTQGDA